MLEGFLAPRSVAVIGAAREVGKVGRSVFDNLLAAGFAGPVYPINPHADEIAGHRAYPDVASLPEVPDLAVIAVPAAAVEAAVEECGEAGCRSVVVITAGFKETGPAGAALERRVVAAARRHDMRLLGPNCLGVVATPSSLNASFAATMPPRGRIAFMSQSGALGTAILDWSAGKDAGVAYFTSLGNKADITEVDFMRAWRDDEMAGVVVAYLESVSDGPAFVDAASALTAVKPLVVIKAGGSDAGARAVSSHTGSLAGSEEAYEAAFRRAGVIRAGTVEELFDLAVAFSGQPLPGPGGVAVVTNAGGPAILATDACERAGVVMAALEPETVAALEGELPAAAGIYNPVDLLGDAGPDRYRAAVGILSADPNVSALLVILTPQSMTDITGSAAAIAEAAVASRRTTLACVMGEVKTAPALPIIRKAGVPVYEFPERAVTALAAMRSYRARRETPVPPTETLAVDRDAALAALAGGPASGGFVTEERAAEVVRAYGICTPRAALAHDLAESRRLAEEIGYPVAMKVASPDVLHKTDVGGVRLGIADERALTDAYEDLLSSVVRRMPGAQVYGVEIQEMVLGGTEMIVGLNRDPTFGPLLLVGLGGVFVEALHDVVVRLCPVERDEAREMVSAIRGFAILRGARGRPHADTEALADVLVRVGRIGKDLSRVVELDINPLIVRARGEGAVAVDIRIGIGGEGTP